MTQPKGWEKKEDDVSLVKNDEHIKADEWVTAHKYGNSLEISNVAGSTPVVLKFDRDHMVNTITGEIIDIQHATDRADPKNLESLRHTFKRLKRLIGANFKGGKSEIWVTLTYRWADYSGRGNKEPMTDQKRLFHDFHLFMRRLRKQVGKYIAYIVAVEPQASGAFHCHVLMKTLDGSRLYVSNKDMSDCWQQGFVNVRRLKNSDNVSAYLMAYLTDIDIKNPDGKLRKKSDSKSIIKGGRLGLYPMHFQLYRRSRKGIKNPQKLKGTCGQIKQHFQVKKTLPDYYKAFNIKSSSGANFKIKTEYYDLRSNELKAAVEKKG